MTTKPEREVLLELMREGRFWRRDQRTRGADQQKRLHMASGTDNATPPLSGTAGLPEPSRPAQVVLIAFCCVAVAVLCVLGWGRK